MFPIFQMHYFIFATDSRGAGLQQQLRQPRSDTSVIFRPGATIQTIMANVTPLLQNVRSVNATKTIHVTLAAGICNLTEKIHHDGGTEVIYLKDLDYIQKFILEI